MSKHDVNGVLLLNKSLGLSSNAALQKVKRIFNAVKAGHTGTLDPLATGLLPICFGEATKFSSFLLNGNKEYLATIKLGITTTTYDAEGEVVRTRPVELHYDIIKQCVFSFVGNIRQIPPLYSALKVNGKPLYQYARSGIEVEIQPREITIHEIEVKEYIAPDIITIRVLSSKGTYIRTLAHDIGDKLDCGAHLINLKRTKLNEFILNEKITLNYLLNLTIDVLQELLLPIDIMLQSLVCYSLNSKEFAIIKNGHAFMCDKNLTQQFVRLYYQGIFLGVATQICNLIKPVRLVNTATLMLKL